MSQLGKIQRLRFDDDITQSESQHEFEELLKLYDYSFGRGDIVTGRVISIESSGAYVDIGAKTAAYVPFKEIVSTPGRPGELEIKPSEIYDFFILREEDEEGQFTLSRKRVFMAQNWKRLEELMNTDAVVEGTVTMVVKGGLLVDIMGLRGFVPSSHLRIRDSLDSLVNTTLPLKILSLDQQTNNIILSHRKVMAEQMAEQRRELFVNLQVGTVVEGEVVRLTDFGAFIDLGGIDGLLPLSQMSWRWVEHPSDVLSVGEKIRVEVIGIDQDKQRVSLSVKSLYNDPWNEVTNTIHMGDRVEGTITRLKHFGAFVEVYPGVEALLPSKDIAEHESSTGSKLESGQKIQVYVVKFNPEERRISLSFNPQASMSQASHQIGSGAIAE